MPNQLLTRLHRFFDQHVRESVMSVQPPAVRRTDLPGPVPAHPPHPNMPAPNIRAHWPDGVPQFGDEIASPQSIVIHGTGGWPSHQSAGNFENLYRSVNSLDWSAARGWYDRRGYGPQYFVDPNGTAFNLIGPADLAGAPRLTWHAEEMNKVSVGIENSDIADSGAHPSTAGNGPRWWQLTTAATDLTGMKAYLLLHPGDKDAILAWFAVPASFPGAGDLTGTGADTVVNRQFSNWANMLFTERNYRTLALLSRLVCERLGIPRSFPLFPYATRAHDCRDHVLFRSMLLADPACDQIATRLGTTTAAVRANDDAYETWYHGTDYTVPDPDNPGHVVPRNRYWTRFFGASPRDANPFVPCFKGFVSHSMNGNHPCPGPLFDWHRFARETTDWWWYPFDFTKPPDGPAAVATTPRPYRQARRDTPLVDYYFDAAGTVADYEVYRDASAPAGAGPDRFIVGPDAPLYAMANGIVVAARMPAADDVVDPGFVLTRHEIFHTPVAGRIDYETAPTVVWSLVTFLATAGARPDQHLAANPDWLNRFAVRLTETTAAMRFIGAHMAVTDLQHALTHTPAGAGPRLSIGQEIDVDAQQYTALAGDLAAGRVTLFPLESATNVTPVRVLLGDYLGLSGALPGRLPDTQRGVQVELFSKAELPVPGRAARKVSASDAAWWRRAAGAARREGDPTRDLPADGMAWQYPMHALLQWANQRTWASEWAKYGVTQADGTAAPPPPQPNPRRIAP